MSAVADAIARGSVRPVRRSGLRDEVYRTLLRMLIEGDIAEREPLRVDALARLLDVSPTPVREALVQLETTGLVEYVANRGYRAADALVAEEMRSIMDARLVLEVAAVRRAAARPDRRFVEAMEACIAGQRAAAERLSPGGMADRDAVREYLDLDHDFHDALFRESGNPYLARLAQRMDAQSQRARQSFLHGVDDACEAITEHERILDAVRRGDADQAEAAVESHLRRVLDKALTQA